MALDYDLLIYNELQTLTMLVKIGVWFIVAEWGYRAYTVVARKSVKDMFK